VVAMTPLGPIPDIPGQFPILPSLHRLIRPVSSFSGASHLLQPRTVEASKSQSVSNSQEEYFRKDQLRDSTTEKAPHKIPRIDGIKLCHIVLWHLAHSLTSSRG
jgi:hypothetical protein